MGTRDWKKVKGIFHEALRLKTGERDTYLDGACGEDINLRIEVESLLISLTEAKSFLENPIIGYTGEPASSSTFSDGQNVSHYRVIRHIASGGMGEVYLAEDQKLHRNVALKILPEHMLADKERLRRFQIEAKAVSALNHPNILTIFEFDEANGLHLFVSEYVMGETLRDRLKREKISVADTIEITIQTASALNAAHETGIVHRDIKPENIMIRDDGYVKVLDFGLAKLTKAIFAEEQNDALRVFYSRPGLIMGTSGYLSPEQARAGPIDNRTDIFSLGVVLYEMLTGKAPFEAPTKTDVMAAIVQMDPRPPSLLNKNVSKSLDRIVARMLKKDRASRYQSASDLILDLKKAKKHLEDAKTGSRTRSLKSLMDSIKVSDQGFAVSADDRLAPSKRKKSLMIAGAFALILVLIAIAGFWLSSDPRFAEVIRRIGLRQ